MIIALLVVLPIFLKVPNFPFMVQNFIFVFIFLNWVRYLFLLKYTPFSQSKWFKLVLLFITLPLLVYLTDWLSMFQEFKDNGELLDSIEFLSFKEQGPIRRYIENEYVFFGVAAVVTSLMMPFRMIVSIWRVRNRGTV